MLLPEPWVDWLGGWAWPVDALLQVLVALLVASVSFVLLGVVTRRVERAIVRGDAGPGSLGEQRARTLVGLVRSVGLTFIVIIAVFSILGMIGYDIRPLLAGAGIFGLAISFGAQSLVRDIITGLFILFENQFGVGDVVKIGDVGGIVERMTLRVTVLRDVHGIVHVIPNGEIKRVSNMTRSWSRAVLEIGVAYKENVDRVMEVMRQVGAELWNDADWQPVLVEEPVVPGIESFGDSGVNIRIMAKTVPLKQWEVARELRRRLKNRFDAEKIEIPFPHRTLYWGDAGRERAETGAERSFDGEQALVDESDRGAQIRSER